MAADAKTATAEPEKKKRKPQGPRKPRVLNALISADENGAITVHVASYDAMKLLQGVKQFPDAALVEITPA